MEKGRTNPYTLEFFPNQYEIPVTFVRTVAEELCALKFVTNHFDTKESVLNQYTSARSLGNLSLIF